MKLALCRYVFSYTMYSAGVRAVEMVCKNLFSKFLT